MSRLSASRRRRNRLSLPVRKNPVYSDKTVAHFSQTCRSCAQLLSCNLPHCQRRKEFQMKKVLTLAMTVLAVIMFVGCEEKSETEKAKENAVKATDSAQQATRD